MKKAHLLFTGLFLSIILLLVYYCSVRQSAPEPLTYLRTDDVAKDLLFEARHRPIRI